MKKRKPNNGIKMTSVSEEMNAVFDYVKKHMQEASKKDKQDAARQCNLNNLNS